LPDEVAVKVMVSVRAGWIGVYVKLVVRLWALTE